MTKVLQHRAYQERSVRDVEACLAEKSGAVLLVLPTGTGKTATAGKIIDNRVQQGNDRPIFLAPRREIVKQTADTLCDFMLDPGVVMSGIDYYPKKACHVASIDTLRSWIKRGKVRLNHEDTCFVDEAHRSISPTYRWLIEAYLDAGADVVGMTATPIRSDGVGLGHVYKHMVVGLTMVDAIKQGYLVKPEYRIASVPDLSGVPIMAGDFSKKDLERVLNQRMLIGDIVDNWLKHAAGMSTLGFAAGVKHSIAMTEQFKQIGVEAVHIDHGTDKGFRDTAVKRFRAGNLKVLISCGVFTEGTDFPNVQCIIDAGPTMSLGKHLQKLGRGGRPLYAPGHDISTVKGRLEAIHESEKPRFMILDNAGNFYRNGRMDRNVPWELCDGKEIVEKAREKYEKAKVSFTCDNCGRVFGGQLYCPDCGTPVKKTGKMRDYVDAELVGMTNGQFAKIETTITAREMKDFYLGLLYWAREPRTKRRKSDPDQPRRKDGFAAVLFREKHGIFPPRDWQFCDPKKPSIETLNYIRGQNIRYAKGKAKEAAESKAK